MGVRGLLLVLSLALAACSSHQAYVAGPQGPAGEVELRLAGLWHLNGYVPEKELPPSLTLELQDKILIRFEDGMLRSASSSLDFRRRYRIADVDGDTFKVFIEDKAGIEIESHCRFDEGGNIIFETKTEPWRGRGTLARDDDTTQNSGGEPEPIGP